MAIHNPPYYRYSFEKPGDIKTITIIKTIAKSKRYPKILGGKEDINQYLTMLIRTQKSLNDWRDFLIDTLHQIQTKGNIDTSSLVQKYPPQSIGNDTPAWVTYPPDKIVNDFMDGLETRKINFMGSNEEIAEFILRFILGQYGHDWESTILMIWEMLGDKDVLSVRALNNEMKNFDYLKIFS